MKLTLLLKSHVQMSLSFVIVLLLSIWNTMSSYSGVSGPASKGVGESLSRTDRYEECSEWEQEWNERRERVCAGAEREVASSRAQRPAASPGSRQQKRSGDWEGIKHPGRWRLQGRGETPNLELRSSFVLTSIFYRGGKVGVLLVKKIKSWSHL